MFTVYYVLNLVNDKAYVGITKTKLKYRWRSHCREAETGGPRLFCRAIRKYGADSFQVRQIDAASTKERADELEKFYIKLFDTTNRARGYNITEGGGGTVGLKQDPQMVAARVAKNSGSKHWKYGDHTTTPGCEKSHFVKGMVPWNKGGTHSLETREKLRTASLGQVVSPETRAKISATLTGKKKKLPGPMSEHHKQAIRTALLAKFALKKSLVV